MILGYSTNAFTRFGLEEALRHIADLGFKGVEIMCDQPHLYPPQYDTAKLNSLVAVLKRLNLAVTNLNSFTLFAVGDTYLPSWIEDEPQQRRIRIEHTRDCLNIAKKLNCRNISIPPGGPLNGLAPARAVSRFLKGLEAVIPLAESLNVMLLVEPEPDLMIERTAQFQDFMKNIRSPAVGINFDIGHFYCAGEDPVQAFEILFEWIGHVHLEDIGQSRVHQHLIPGDGAIDLAAVFKAMQRLGYRKDMSLELYPYVNLPAVAGRKSLAYLGPLLVASGIDH